MGDLSSIIEAIIAAYSGANKPKDYSTQNVLSGQKKFDMTMGIFEQIGVFGKGVMDVMYNIQTNVLDTNRELLSQQASIVSKKLDLINATVSTYMGALTGSFEMTANRLMAKQAKAMMDLAKKNVETEFSIKLAQAQMEKARLKLYTETAKPIAGLAYSLMSMGIGVGGSAISTLANSELGAKLFQGTATYLAGHVTDNLVASLSGSDFAGGLAGALSSVMVAKFAPNLGNFIAENSGILTGAAEGLIMATNGLLFHARELTADFAVKLAEFNIEVMEKAQELAGNMIDGMRNAVEPWIDMTDKITEAAEQFDSTFRAFTVTAGYIGRQGDMYVRSQLAIAEHIGATFGKSAEDMVNVLKGYQDAAGGRQVNMSQSNYDTQFSTGRLFGMGDSEVASLYGGMNIFNTSIDSAGDKMEKMYKTITKMGLSTSKFGKDLTENLKKAQKYNFKGGVENMMKLTQWAQQTRFNLDAATGFSDKLLGGSLSDAIEASAKLQVLGGAAAIYSDPLGMIYDAGADVGSLAKRQAAMFSDVSGTFNAKTGETDFSWYENYMIKQRAAAAGMSEEDAKNMIRQANKQGTINKVLRDYNLDDETKTAIGNRATYNQKTGSWEVTDIRGETHNIEDYASGRLNIEDLLPENNDEAMLKIAEKSLGFAEQQTFYQKAIMLRFASSQYDAIVRESNNNLDALKQLHNNENINDMLSFHLRESNELGRSSIYRMSDALNDPRYLKLAKNYYTGAQRDARGGDIGMLLTASQYYAQSAEALANYAQSLITKDFVTMNNAIQGGEKVFEQSMGAAMEQMNQFFTITQAQFMNPVVKLLGGIATNLGMDTSKLMQDMSQLQLFNNSRYSTNSNGNVNNGRMRYSDYPVIRDDSIIAKFVGSIFNLGDGVGMTNGGFITGASNVQSIEDGSGITGTSKYDQFLVAKSGGPIDKLFDGVIGGISNLTENVTKGSGSKEVTINLVISGSLDLEGNGSYDIIKELKTNDTFAKNMASVLARNITSAVSGNADKGRFNWGSV